MLLEPASAGRHACHSVVRVSLISEGTERAAGRHSIVPISPQLIDEVAHERLISGDIHLMRVAANVTARSAVECGPRLKAKAIYLLLMIFFRRFETTISSVNAMHVPRDYFHGGISSK